MGLIKKAEEAITGHPTSTNTSANNGPHNSSLANKLDPRVDSDRGKWRYSIETSSETNYLLK